MYSLINDSLISHVLFVCRQRKSDSVIHIYLWNGEKSSKILNKVLNVDAHQFDSTLFVGASLVAFFVSAFRAVVSCNRKTYFILSNRFKESSM